MNSKLGSDLPRFEKSVCVGGGGGDRCRIRKLLVVAEDFFFFLNGEWLCSSSDCSLPYINKFIQPRSLISAPFPVRQDQWFRCISLRKTELSQLPFVIWPLGHSESFRTATERQTARLAAFDHDYNHAIWHRDGGQQCGLGMYTVNSLMPCPLPQFQGPYCVLSKS